MTARIKGDSKTQVRRTDPTLPGSGGPMQADPSRLHKASSRFVSPRIQGLLIPPPRIDHLGLIVVFLAGCRGGMTEDPLDVHYTLGISRGDGSGGEVSEAMRIDRLAELRPGPAFDLEGDGTGGHRGAVLGNPEYVRGGQVLAAGWEQDRPMHRTIVLHCLRQGHRPEGREII